MLSGPADLSNALADVIAVRRKELVDLGAPVDFLDTFLPKLTPAGLNRLIDVTYHASMSPDEGRLPRFTTVSRRHPNFWCLAELNLPLSDVNVLRRLAPTCSDPSHAIRIDEVDYALVCRGLITLDPLVRIPGELAPSRLQQGPGLEIRVCSPGHLRVRLVADGLELKAGTLRALISCWLTKPLAALAEHVGQVSLDGCDQGTVKKVSADPKNEIGRIGSAFRNVFTRIIRRIVDDAHGGCLVVLPPGVSADAIDVKIAYPVTGTNLSAALSRLWEACAANRAAADKAEAQDACRREEWCWQQLLTTADLLRRAAAVDGCVVLSRDLSLLGFGAEIVIRDAALPPNCVLFDSETKEELALEAALKTVGGTRHRSAMRLCMKVAGAVAIVVSQDGDLTVFSSDSARTTRYAHLHASEIDLNFS
jgi:hypothetical protein